MTTLIFNQPTPDGPVTLPHTEDQEAVIKNTFFWPDVEPSRLRKLMRLEGTVTPERLRHAALSAIAEVNAELFLYREAQQADGYRHLQEVPGEQLDGESEKLHHYLRAVSSVATATLYERYRSYDSSGKGNDKAGALDSTVDELWRDARWSIQQLQGRPRCIIGHI